MTLQDIKDKFEQSRSRYLIGKIDYAFESNQFVQVVLTVISEEADFVETIDATQDVFENNSKEPVCYVKFNHFLPYLEDEYEDVDNKPWDEQISIIEEYLQDKLVIIKPYYYYNEGRNVFFKNGTVAAVIEKETNYSDSFFTIPVIPNQNAYESFLKKEQFPMPSISKEIMGTPDYLYYDGKIFKATLNALETNDVYWQNSNEDNSMCELNVDCNKLEEVNDLITCDNNTFVFVRKNAIINSKPKTIEETTAQVVEEESKEAQDTNYGLSDIALELNKFIEYTKNANLCYSRNDIYNFYTCVCASQLMILAGMSGTGKTKLPLKFAEYFNMTEDNNTLLFVPVSPSFTEPSDVLGYLNPSNGLYVSSETRLVEFLRHAELNPDKMHMVLFDEMNLAQIEFWFAPFMSILEKDVKDRKIVLYSDSQRCINCETYPSSISIGRNIIFVGTINLDETTKNISDRLLDRAYIINLKKETFINYQAQQLGKNSSVVNPFDGDFMQFMPKEDESFYNYIEKFKMRQLEFFDRVHNELNKIDSQKGISFRSVKNISLYLKHKPVELDDNLAFDYAFKQTVMKKINGSFDSIGAILGTLDDKGNPEGLLINIFNEFSDVSDFKECRNEIKNKILELKKYGYAR